MFEQAARAYLAHATVTGQKPLPFQRLPSYAQEHWVAVARALTSGPPEVEDIRAELEQLARLLERDMPAGADQSLWARARNHARTALGLCEPQPQNPCKAAAAGSCKGEST